MSRRTATLLAASLVLGATMASADPGKQQNQNAQGGQNPAQKKGQQAGYEKDYDEDYADIRRIFEQHGGKTHGQQSLPPGISKNLQRGKPLPPGIAKRFDADIERLLPYYPGKQWRQVGNDAVLIDASTSVVLEIMKGVLQ